MKKINLSLMVLLMLIICCNLTVLGSEASDMNNNKLNLEKAVAKALEGDLDLKQASLNLKRARLQYQQNKASNLIQNSRYSESQTEHQLSLIKSNYKNTTYSVVNSTIQQYKNLWLSKLDLQIKEKRVKLQKKLLSEAEAQYEIGDIGSVDLLEAQNSYKDAKFNLETARDDYKQNMKRFKLNLGLEKDPVLKNLEQPEVWELTEEEAVSTALDNSVNLQLKKQEVELARMNYERAKISSPELEKKIKEVALQISEIEKEKTEKNIISSTEAAYYQFQQAIKNLELKQQRLHEARKKFQIYQQQYEKGLIKKTDIFQYEINKMESQKQYKTAISNYYLKEQSLKQAMNLEAGVDLNDNTNKE
jgi:outer membrane protein TolC